MRSDNKSDTNYYPDQKTYAIRRRALLFYVLGGIAVFAIFVTIQITVVGFAASPKAFIVPLTVGACSGFIIGLLQLRNKKLLYQERQAVKYWRHEREKTVNILASIADGLLVTDGAGKIEFVNTAAQQMLNIPYEKIVATELYTLLNSMYGLELKSDTLGNGYTAQLTINTSDAEERNVLLTASTIRNTSSNTKSVIVLLHDNTEEHLIDLMKSEFISSATHNLKTPITAITGYSELLQTTDNLSAQQTREFIGYINDKAWELNSLVNTMLDVNRAEAGRKINLSTTVTPAATLLNAARGYCGEQQSPCDFAFEFNDSDCQLNVDAEKINMAMRSIIDNAIKFSPAGGTVTISSRCNPSSSNNLNTGYLINISDEGIGMSKHQCRKIFDKFYRVDSSDSAPKGIGLGLTVAKSLIESHGGKIWVSSMPGQGTTLSFLLPIGDTAGHEID